MAQVSLRKRKVPVQAEISIGPAKSDSKTRVLNHRTRNQSTPNVRKSGRFKKPKLIFDPSNCAMRAAEYAPSDPDRDPYPMEVPNVAGWTAEQLFEFLRDYLPEAEVFLQQQIDGDTLLLLRRKDIVKRMPFDLDTALRIYRFVVILQSELPEVFYEPTQKV